MGVWRVPAGRAPWLWDSSWRPPGQGPRPPCVAGSARSSVPSVTEQEPRSPEDRPALFEGRRKRRAGPGTLLPSQATKGPAAAQTQGSGASSGRPHAREPHRVCPAQGREEERLHQQLWAASSWRTAGQAHSAHGRDRQLQRDPAAGSVDSAPSPERSLHPLPPPGAALSLRRPSLLRRPPPQASSCSKAPLGQSLGLRARVPGPLWARGQAPESSVLAQACRSLCGQCGQLGSLGL